MEVLIIDDHPIQIDGYKSILSLSDINEFLNITACYNCEEAYKIITTSQNKNRFVLAIIDYSIPPYEDQNLFNGQDVARLMQRYFPETKIVIITSHTEAIVLYNILKKVNPHGLLVKSDIDGEELLVAFSEITKGNTYYSESVIKAKKTLISKEELLDTTNRKIIELLAQGIKTKNLPTHLALSQSAIEKRKSTIKDVLGITKGNDEDILREVRKLGLL
ncbi:DNA-binding NarL/FixJ family response regulator [Winogradskyella pacifica]|uniref:DNA-binding NarL/FixJ family response regulator n=1 Tax=Winogradskyella pacifica TaxID=664642 RepID=A0A3D9LPL7_9FLAO|nr:response regulator [Winogradskyella pacifica]REE08377.1 DNA-binding NarL/FixJ family response regulator [Winogradskyella pacifica]